MEEKFSASFFVALKRLNLEIKKVCGEERQSKKIKRMKTIVELLKEQVPSENTNRSTR